MTSQQIETFLSFLRECEQQFHIAEADELEANAVTNDIHHDLELAEHSQEDLAELAQALSKVRRKRRTAKDAMAELGPVLAWLDETRAVVKGLERLLGEVRRAERRTENRVYTPRTNPALWRSAPDTDMEKEDK